MVDTTLSFGCCYLGIKAVNSNLVITMLLVDNLVTSLSYDLVFCIGSYSVISLLIHKVPSEVYNNDIACVNVIGFYTSPLMIDQGIS